MSEHDINEQPSCHYPAQSYLSREDVEQMFDEELEDLRRELLPAIETIDRDIEVEGLVSFPDHAWMTKASHARKHKSRQLRWVMSEMVKRGMISIETSAGSPPEREIASEDAQAAFLPTQKQLNVVIERERNMLRNEARAATNRADALLRKVAALTAHIDDLVRHSINRKKARQMGEPSPLEHIFMQIAKEELPEVTFQRLFHLAVEKERRDVE